MVAGILFHNFVADTANDLPPPVSRLYFGQTSVTLPYLKCYITVSFSVLTKLGNFTVLGCPVENQSAPEIVRSVAGETGMNQYSIHPFDNYVTHFGL
jgi:hypothetical protein